MKQLGGFTTFCCWLSAFGFAAAILYSLLHFLSGGFGSLIELALVAALAAFFLSAAAPAIQKRIVGFLGVLPVLFMGGGALVAVMALSGRIIVGSLNPNSYADPEASVWLAILGPAALWLVFAGVTAGRARLWTRDLSTLATLAGVGLVLACLSAVVPVAILSIVATLLAACLPAFLVLVATRHGSGPSALRIALATVLPIVLLMLAFNVHASRGLAVREAAWLPEVAAYRVRVSALRMPVLRGAAGDCNAYDGYRPAMEATNSFASLLPEFSTAGLGDPLAPIPGKVLAVLETHAPLIQRFREATRCARVDFGEDYDQIPNPVFAPASLISHLTLVAGHQKAQAGDVRAASEHYLDVARFGADLESQGANLIQSLMGRSIRDMALRALGSLVVGKDLDAAEREQVVQELLHLEATPPSLSKGFAGERLSLFRSVRGGAFAVWEQGALPIVNAVAGRPVALRLLEAEGLLAETSEAIDMPDFEAAARRMADIESRTAAAWPGSLLSIFVPNGRPLRDQLDVAKAHHALIQLALRIEGLRSKDGRYPAAVEGLPLDPFLPSGTLQYSVTGEGTGYRIWSAGPDRQDNKGNGQWQRGEGSQDIVLERKPAI